MVFCFRRTCSNHDKNKTKIANSSQDATRLRYQVRLVPSIWAYRAWRTSHHTSTSLLKYGAPTPQHIQEKLMGYEIVTHQPPVRLDDQSGSPSVSDLRIVSRGRLLRGLEDANRIGAHVGRDGRRQTYPRVTQKHVRHDRRLLQASVQIVEG